MLVEDHELVRAGMSELLCKLSNVSEISEASNGREALRLVERLQPDLVFMDIAMPDMNGLEATARMRKLYPHIQIIMLSMYATEEYVLQALRAGAAGYLLKDSGKVELELAIRAVTQGQTYLSPTVATHVAEYMRRVEQATSDLPVSEQLTPRQREILQLIAEGRSTQEIAQTLIISVKTVETHRAQLMQRLGIFDVAGLVRYAIRTGIVIDAS
ncbi:MAG TPA: response regulator transcription factor [Herpetosiphonaceae bacterium]|nr:response regulator transcription factor [Herpetosiphonaceae bacterium]